MRAGGYPCWLYAVTGPRLIADEAEHLALEGDWYESPADIPEAETARAALEARAAAAGVAIDGRWSSKRLEAEVLKAEAAKAPQAPPQDPPAA